MTGRATREAGTRRAGTLLVVGVLLLAGCTGNARPPVVTRTGDATPVPAPAPEQTRVPVWTPDPTEAREQAVQRLGLRWPDGTPVAPEVVAPADVVPAVEGEHFRPFASHAMPTARPLAVLADGSMVVRGEVVTNDDGEWVSEAMGLVGPKGDEPFREFDMSGVSQDDTSVFYLASEVSVEGQTAVWTLELASADVNSSAAGWQVLAADDAGIVTLVASSDEDWHAVHEHALDGPRYVGSAPTPVVAGGRVYFLIPVDDAATSGDVSTVLVSRDLAGGDTRVDAEGVWNPVATTDAVYARGESALVDGALTTSILRVGGDPVLLLPSSSPLSLDGTVGEWLLLSSSDAVVAVHPEERRVVAIGRATSSDPDWPGSGPAMGGSDVAVWSDDPYAEDGGIYYVMDPDTTTVWSLPSLLHGVVLSSRGTLGWMEATGSSQGVRYVRWQS